MHDRCMHDAADGSSIVNLSMVRWTRADKLRLIWRQSRLINNTKAHTNIYWPHDAVAARDPSAGPGRALEVRNILREPLQVLRLRSAAVMHLGRRHLQQNGPLL